MAQRPKKKTKSKYVFTLKGIDLMKVNAKFDINTSCNIPSNSHIHPDNTTDLSTLQATKSLHVAQPMEISFLDQSKRLRMCTVSSVDLENGPRWCWWCKHQFDSPPWGCPMGINASISEKTYVSSISKTSYTLREKTLKSDDGVCTYITDGMFCTVNCCRAWVEDNTENPDYELSPFLLTKMYRQVCVNYNKDLPVAAPHWRLLERFGGYLSIHKFRENFQKVEYVYMGQTNVRSISRGHCFEEKLKF